MLGKFIYEKRIDGKKISEEIGHRLFFELKDKGLVGKASLGILCVGNDPASLSFINVKKKFGERYGFKVNVSELNIVSEFDNKPDLMNSKLLNNFKNEIILKLKHLQQENDAVIVQLPLPYGLRDCTDEILSYIDKSKDVDNLNNGNFIAPIVLALQKILDILSDDWTIKKFAVVGLGRVVGLPLFQYLQEKKYSVEKVTRWGQFTNGKKYDVIISAAGSPMLIVGKEIKEDTILIDYGCSPYATVNGVQKFCGDFDVSCYEKCKHYTPVPGCMGPLVVASLFENVLKSIKTEN